MVLSIYKVEKGGPLMKIMKNRLVKNVNQKLIRGGGNKSL